MSHTFDAAGRETVLENRKSSGAALQVYAATCDGAGNRSTVQELDGTRVTYAYDTIYQLVNEQRGGANAYNKTLTYDGVRNRLTQNDTGSLTTYTFNSANELTLLTPPSGQPTTSSYDGNGNLRVDNTGGALTTYTWDSENRLTRIDNPDGTNEQYTYSAEGLRQKKITSAGTILYVWDGQNVLLEQQ